MSPERESSDDAPTVLAIDDDHDLADTYAIWLGDQFDVRTAYGGEAALEKLDEDVDVVLLDRRMPDLSGCEVLERIRDRGLPCRVAMLTAVEPNEDIVDMPFDEYLVKPVTRDELVSAVEDLHSRLELDDTLQEYYAVTSKIAALQSELSPEERADSDALDALRTRADELAADAEDTVESIDDAEEAFREADT